MGFAYFNHGLFNHGLGTISQSLDLYVWFVKAPAAKARTSVKKTLTTAGGFGALVRKSGWSGRRLHLYLASGRSGGFEGLVMGNPEYALEAPAGWAFAGSWLKHPDKLRRLIAFEAAVDDALAALHSECRISFVASPKPNIPHQTAS